MKRTIQLIASVLFLTGLTHTQASLVIRVDRFIRSEMARQQIPGVSLAVVRDGRPLLVKGYGFANIEHQVLVRPETIFPSWSKRS